MYQNFPKYIESDKDLAVYERYIKNEQNRKISQHIQIETPSKPTLPENLSNPVFFQCFLRKHIGKLIKAESLIGNRLDSRTGILMDVGSDYMVIKPTKHCVTTVIDLKCVKYVSVIHDNDHSKTGWV